MSSGYILGNTPDNGSGDRSKLNAAAIGINRNMAGRLYWDNRFRNFELNAYFGEPALLSGVGADRFEEWRSQANADTSEKLFSIAPTGKSKHALLLSLLSLLAHKCSSLADVCIFTPPYGDSQVLIPVRTTDISDKDIRSYLGWFSNHLVQDLQQGNFPLPEILHIERSKLPDYSLTAMVLEEIQSFSLQEAPRQKDATGPSLPVDLLFSFTIREGLGLTIRFNPKKYSLSYIKRLSAWYFQLLSDLPQLKDTKIKDISLLSREEKEYTLFGFNNTTRLPQNGEHFVPAFREMAKTYPERQAFSLDEKNYTYRELDHWSDQVASYLSQTYGLGVGQQAGLLLEREEFLLPVLLGVLKTGAAYVPIDPLYPEKRKTEILEEARLRLLITRTKWIDDLAGWKGDIINLDQHAAHITAMPSGFTTGPSGPGDLAYVLFTSGSTGKPKGVMITHRALYNYIDWAARYYVGTAGGNFPLYTSVSFDLTVTSIFVPLLTGHKIIIRRDVEQESILEELILNKEIDIIKLTPSQLKTITYRPSLRPDPALPPRKLIVGGEDLSSSLARAVYDQFNGHIEIYNEYGPTEATVGCMIHRFDPAEPTLSVPIGTPIDNARVYLLDADQNPVPPCVRGEIYIGGKGVAEGYLFRDDLTARSFLPNPFVPGERMYRTGDLAVRDDKGNVLFQGRVDEQVKLRGYRIEPGEIGMAMLGYPGIKEAVVLVWDRDGEKSLVGYYVADTELAGLSLREHLLNRLPEYMVPGTYVRLGQLPLSSNGKVDRRRLPEPQWWGGEVEAPSGRLEERLAQCWSEVLHVPYERLSVTRPFFELGGHSLKAVELVNRMARDLGVQVSLRELFGYRDIRSLGAWLLSSGAKSQYRPIAKAPQRKSYGLSPSQKRLYFLYELDKESLAYNMPRCVRLSGPLAVDRLTRAFRQLVHRHEILRTRFVMEDGELVQQVLEDVTLPVETPGGEPWDFVRPFDLGEGPLLRVGLQQQEGGDHLLLVDMHHIVSDGMSQEILISDLAKLYRGEELQELQLQYKDYAAWLEEEEQRALLVRQREFWLKEYADMPAVPGLPSDHPRPLIRGYRGGLVTFELGEETTALLQSLAQREGCTPFMVLLSAYTILLSRLSGSTDIVVGTPVGGRRHADLEGIIGVFVNTLALRNYPMADMRYVDFLRELRQRTLLSFDHQDYPYEELVEALRPERVSGHNPLFDVVFAYENFGDGRLEMDDITITPWPMGEGISKFDLVLTGWESGGRIQLSFGYAADLFEHATIERYADYLVRIVSSVLSGEEKALSGIGLLGEAETQLLIEELGRNRVSYRQDRTIVDGFEEQALLHPDAVAVACREQELTYGQLDRQANRLANYLLRSGIRPEEFIPICSQRSTHMIVALLGILKAGGVYVPIDPEYPRDRIGFILEDIHARWLLTDGYFEWPSTDISIYNIETLLHTIQAEPATSPALPLTGASLAYVNYTSGSMGYPKGVMVMHRSVPRLLILEDIPFDTTTVTLLLSSVSFDAATLEIWAALLGGGRLVIYPDKYPDTGLLNHTIRQQGVNTLWLTSGLLDQWSDSDIGDTGLQYLLSGGDVVHPATVRKIYDKLPGVAIYNGYGPTENTTFTCTYKIPPDRDFQSIPIGKPVTGTAVYILDGALNLTPRGSVGELYTSGAGLARGYVDNDLLTREKFLANPFVPGERMYRTGDRVRWLPDGNMEFAGRVDEQVKVRGYRIEPGEVERVLGQSSGVRQSVVVAREEADGSKRLIGYLVVTGAYDREEVLAHLRSRLPEYMVPSALVVLPEIPLTGNGKVDRKALPDPGRSRVTEEPYRAPGNAMERKLVAIWEELLPVERIGIGDDFFALGGHSLLAMRTVSAIRRQLAAELSLRDLFTHPTIARLAEYLQKQPGGILLPALHRQVRPDRIPLSFSQERLWLIDQLGGSVQYHMPTVLRLKGSLDKEALEYALGSIVDRHEVLQTVIEQDGGAPYQRLLEGRGWRLGVTEGSVYREEEASLRNYIDELIGIPFDLSRDYKLRAHLICLSQQEHVLVVTLHHIASDGWSNGILVREFAEFYDSYRTGRTAELEALPVQYTDYAIWQRQYLSDGELSGKLGYWQRQLQGAATLELPTDHVRPPVRTVRGGLHRLTIGRELTVALGTLSREEGGTLYMTLLAVFNVLLHRYSGQMDISVGSPIAGRQQQEVEGLIGFFVNTLVLRSELGGDPSFRELLGRIRQTTLEAYDHQDVPFEKVVEAVVKERDMSRSPLFQVLFALQNNTGEPIVEDSIKGLELLPVDAANNTSKFDLSLLITEGSEELGIGIEYAADLFTEATIARMGGHYRELLGAVAEKPDSRISELWMLPPEEEALLEQFNNTAKDYAHDRTVVDLISEQAARTPEAIAVVFGEERLSYRELEEQSNQLAHYLQRKGVKAGTLVPICIGRSIEMIVGIQGILKAGGAYVPVDATYPPERIAHMLEDTRACVVLSSDASRLQIPLRSGIEVISLDGDREAIAGESVSGGPWGLSGDQLAYVIYTSGTTGLPKGAGVYHRGVSNLMQWYIREFEITGRDSNLIISSLGFDLTQKNIFSTLIAGGVLAIPAMEYYDSRTIVKTIGDRGVRIINCAPSAFYQLVEDRDSFEALSSLRLVILGGEPIKMERLSEWLTASDRPCEIVNSYGPTECTDIASYYRMPHAAAYVNRPIPIGHPNDNVKVMVLNESGRRCPIGVWGELYIAGAGVGAGYINDPALTAQKFIDDPFSRDGGSGNDPGSRWYRTGDIGRWMPDGNILFLGRRDDQVKIRGYRVELGEVENVLGQSPGVSQCVVVAREEADGNKRLVGYVVAPDIYDREQILAYLRSRLPEYMVPSALVPLEEIPLTGNGKVNKKALPAPDLPVAGDQWPLAGQTQQALAEIWSDLLGISTDLIGAGSNFFDIGGNSLKLTMMARKIGEGIGSRISIAEIFQFPTIGLLARLIDQEYKPDTSRDEINSSSVDLVEALQLFHADK